jgi:hypothetical protein
LERIGRFVAWRDPRGVGIAARAQRLDLGVDVVLDSDQLGLAVVDEQVAGSRVAVPGKPDAAGVGDSELAWVFDERPVEVAVNHGR